MFAGDARGGEGPTNQTTAFSYVYICGRQLSLFSLLFSHACLTTRISMIHLC